MHTYPSTAADHVSRSTLVSTPEDSGSLVHASAESKHIGALPIVLIAVGSIVFIAVLALFVYPMICERIFGRPNPLRAQHPAPSMWHDPAFVNWGATPEFKRPEAGNVPPTPSSPPPPFSPRERQSHSLHLSSASSPTLYEDAGATRNDSSLGTDLYLVRTRSSHFSAQLRRLDFAPIRTSLSMPSFKEARSTRNIADDDAPPRMAESTSYPVDHMSQSRADSMMHLESHALEPRRFSSNSVESAATRDSQVIPDDDGDSARQISPLRRLSQATIATILTADGGNRVSATSYSTVLGWHTGRRTTVVDDVEAQRGSVYF